MHGECISQVVHTRLTPGAARTKDTSCSAKLLEVVSQVMLFEWGATSSYFPVQKWRFPEKLTYTQNRFPDSYSAVPGASPRARKGAPVLLTRAAVPDTGRC